MVVYVVVLAVSVVDEAVEDLLEYSQLRAISQMGMAQQSIGRMNPCLPENDHTSTAQENQ